MRVPAAYKLVRKYGITRPGVLLLDGEGELVAFRKLVPGGGEKEAAGLAGFLKANAPRKAGKKEEKTGERTGEKTGDKRKAPKGTAKEPDASKKPAAGKRKEPVGAGKSGWY